MVRLCTVTHCSAAVPGGWRGYSADLAVFPPFAGARTPAAGAAPAPPQPSASAAAPAQPDQEENSPPRQRPPPTEEELAALQSMLLQERSGGCSGWGGIPLRTTDDTIELEGVTGANIGLNGTTAPKRSIVVMSRENGLAISQETIDGVGIDYFMQFLVKSRKVPAGKRKSSVPQDEDWCEPVHNTPAVRRSAASRMHAP